MASDKQSRKQPEPQTGAKQASTGGDRSSLPFEPKRKKKVETSAVRASKGSKPPQASSAKATPSNRAAAAIPDVVNRRMLKRMAAFCGVPTALGISTFIVSYLIVSQELFTLPHTAVLLVSLGFFGLGVLGLSYGALSASWDEAAPGSILGWSEFRTNFGRLTGAWQAAGEQKRQGKGS